MLILGFTFLPHNWISMVAMEQSQCTGGSGPTCKLTYLPLKPCFLPLLMQFYLEIYTETKSSWWLILHQGLLNHSSPHICTLSACTTTVWEWTQKPGFFLRTLMVPIWVQAFHAREVLQSIWELLCLHIPQLPTPYPRAVCTEFCENKGDK